MRFCIFDIAISRTTFVITEFKVEFVLTQSNLHCCGTVTFYSVSTATLIRLYEFLKNSLLDKSNT